MPHHHQTLDDCRPHRIEDTASRQIVSDYLRFVAADKRNALMDGHVTSERFRNRLRDQLDVLERMHDDLCGRVLPLV